MNYHCKCCDFNTSNKNDYTRHELTAKHIKRTKSEKTEKTPNKTKYHCEWCDFFTSKKTDYTKHCLTTKHKKNILNVKKLIDEPVIKPTITMTTNEIIPETSQSKDTILMKILESNTQIMEKILLALSQLNHVTTNNNTNNNSNNTTNNQQFNLNFFLNETCKDAINFTEFINSIQVTDDDLENNVKMGFVNGMTKIIVDNLKQLTQNERPIHCTDVKRETIYVKEEDQWDKENSNKVIQRGIQNMNPEYRDFESNLSDFSDAMQQHSMAGTKREDFYPKIIKNIAKETTINEKILQ